MATRTAEAEHKPDRMPSDDEGEVADEVAEELRESGEEESVAAHYREMSERGAHQKGEGRID